MKKLNLFFGLALAIMLVLSSCTKREIDQTVKNVDVVDSTRAMVTYAVQIMSGASNSMAKVSSNLEGVTIVAIQGENSTSVTTNASGQATLRVKPGTIAVTVSAEGHAPMSYTAVLGYGEGSVHHSEMNAASLVTLIPTEGATVEGIVRAELNANEIEFDDQAMERAKNIKIQVSLSDLNAGSLVSMSGNGDVVSASVDYQKEVSTSTTDGSFNFGIPALVNGVSVRLAFEEFRADVPTGETTISTVFTTGDVVVEAVTGKNYVRDINY